MRLAGDMQTAPDALDTRVRRLEDEREIRELLVRYAQRLDARDLAGYAALFAEQGSWSGGMGEAQGPAAIEAMLEKGFGATPAGYVNTDNFHLMSNFVIEVDGDEATAQSRLTYFMRNAENRPAPALAGRYEDRLVREGGRWLFKARKVIGEIPTMAEARAEGSR